MKLLNFGKTHIGYMVLFVFLLILCTCFPYTHDDWGWGTSVGMDLLNNGFKDYNGRYFSNLLVLVLTRFPILKTIVMALTLFLIFIFLKKCVNQKNKNLILIIFILFFTLSPMILSQGLVWTSGFVNYTISILPILIYFYLNRNLLEDKNVKFSQKSIIPLLFLGFITSLILESITIYNFLLSILVIFYTYRKQGHVFLSQIFYFIGSLIGSILMFSNGAYHHILAGDDAYRTVSNGGIIESAFHNYMDAIYGYLIAWNVVLVLAIFVLFVIAAFKVYKEKHKFNIMQSGTIFVITGYSIYLFLKCMIPTWKIIGDYTKYFDGFITCIYLIFLVIFTISFIKNKQTKNKLLFILGSIIIICGTLLIVYPVGSRNFLTTSFLLILFILVLYDYLKIKEKPVRYFLMVGVIVCGTFILSIYAYVKYNDIKRTDYINKQISENNKVIYFPKLPYENYVWQSAPILNKLEGEVQEFYGMDLDTKVEVIPYYERR